MSKIKKAIKSVANLVNDVVPNEIKPVVKVGLALIPGVGPAISAAYSATDAYGGGASLGKALGEGAKSYAISQVAGAASRSLGLTTQGNDLTDALGQTKGEGIIGLGSGASDAAATLGTTTNTAASKALSIGDETFLAKASSTAAAATAADKVAAGAVDKGIGGFLTGDNLMKGAALASGAAAASSLLTGQKALKAPTMPNNITADTVKADASAAADEEIRRRRSRFNSNIYTSPLGLVDSGKSAAAVLLG